MMWLVILIALPHSWNWYIRYLKQMNILKVYIKLYKDKKREYDIHMEREKIDWSPMSANDFTTTSSLSSSSDWLGTF